MELEWNCKSCNLYLIKNRAKTAQISRNRDTTLLLMPVTWLKKLNRNSWRNKYCLVVLSCIKKKLSLGSPWLCFFALCSILRSQRILIWAECGLALASWNVQGLDAIKFRVHFHHSIISYIVFILFPSKGGLMGFADCHILFTPILHAIPTFWTWNYWLCDDHKKFKPHLFFQQLTFSSACKRETFSIHFLYLKFHKNQEERWHRCACRAIQFKYQSSL